MPDSLIFFALVSFSMLLAWALDCKLCAERRAAWREHVARQKQRRHLRQSVEAWKNNPRRWRTKQ